MLRVRTAFTALSQGAAVNTLFFGGDGQSEANDAALAARAFWLALKSNFSTGATAQVEPEVAVVDEATGAVTAIHVVESAAVVGEGGSDPLPFQTQALITLITPLYIGGRRLQGKIFVPGGQEVHNVAALPSAAYRNALSVAAGQLIADSGLLVYSRKNFQSAGVASARVGTKWATLRSRRD